MRLSVIIPCYNEEKRIEESVDKIIKYIKSEKLDAELIFVNDGSTDNTQQILNKLNIKLTEKQRIRNCIISIENNTGKGYALRKGIRKAKGDIILLCDADLSTPITELGKLMGYINNYDLVVGSRKNNDSKIMKPQSFLRTFLGKTYSFMSRIILNVPLNDFTCGFKLIKNNVAKKIVKKMSINRWAYDSELLKIAEIHNFKLKEVGIIWQNDPCTKVKLSTDIIASLRDLIKIRMYSFFKKYD